MAHNDDLQETWAIETRDSKNRRAWLGCNGPMNILPDPSLAIHFEREEDAIAMLDVMCSVARPHQKDAWRFAMPVRVREIDGAFRQEGGDYDVWKRRCTKYRADRIRASWESRAQRRESIDLASLVPSPKVARSPRS